MKRFQIMDFGPPCATCLGFSVLKFFGPDDIDKAIDQNLKEHKFRDKK